MTTNELRQVFQAPYNRQKWSHILHFLNDSKNLLQLRLEPVKIPFDNNEANRLITTFHELGRLKTSDDEEFPIFEVLLNDKVQIGHNKVTVNNFVKRYIIKDAIRGALVTFSYENSNRKEWRFSFISKNTSSDFFAEVESQETHPKKYTYVFGTEESHTTAIQRFFSLHQSNLEVKDFFNAFEVEALNKEFFDGYKNIYEDFVEYITGKRFVKEKGKWVEKEKHLPDPQYISLFKEDDKCVRDYVKKLLGRLVFLYFLQKKGWLNNDVNYLKNLFEESDKTTFLEQVLKPLFFGVLNTKPQERKYLFETEGWNLSLLKEWEQIPYLNGGLFEKDTIDQEIISFSEDLLKNTFQFFSEYNFTIDENDPEDTQIGIDPEMLGKIFENLLEDNKDKGAFYTPKEIVQYMCRESLIAYLIEKHKDEEINIRTLVEQHTSLWSDSTSKAVLESLKEIKVCDPAIGSGAFPMGMLNELYKCRLALGEEKSVKIKKDIIQNNIYGVDIEKGAVDIARLRFWLALVVDETIPEPLPNLDFKIMQGNSLLESFQGVDLSRLVSPQTESYIDQKNGVIVNIFEDILNAHRIELSNCMNDYFSCTDLERKIILRKEIDKKIRQQIKDGHFKIDLSDINLSANPHFFLWHTYFSDVFKEENNLDSIGFDIVIGNPPYVNVEKINPIIKSNIDDFKTAYKKYDLYVLFYERAMQLLKKGGVLSFITSNKFLSQEYGLILRQELLKNTIETIVNFNYDIFNNATVRTCILILSKQEPKYKHSIKLIDINSKKDTENFINRKYDAIFQNVFKTTEYNNFRINLTEEKMSILDKIDENCTILEKICSVNYGLRPSSEILGLKKESFISKDKKDGYKAYFEGKDMGYWKVLNHSFLDYQPKVMYNSMFEELFDNPKLVGLRTLSDIGKLRFIYDNKGYYCNDSVVILTLWYLFENVNNSTIKRNISNEKIELSKEFEYKYLQGILNSKLIKFYVNELFYDGTHFYPNQMKALPIKKASSAIQQLFITLVNMIHYLQPNVSENIFIHTSNIGVASHFQDILDMMVYELYFEVHTKEAGLDVLQFIKPMMEEIQNLPINEQIERFYKWYQQSENNVRQRVLLLDTRSENLLAIINKII